MMLSFLSFTAIYAQQSRITYYLTNSGRLVSTRDSADYSLVVMPPNASSVDKKLNVVYEYNKQGAMRLRTGSYTSDLNLKYQGKYYTYFPDGTIKSAGTYKDGQMTGPQTAYYHNGKLYTLTLYTSPGVPNYIECNDSTGVALAKKGDGVWKQFDDDYTYILAEGAVKSGIQEGEWIFRKSPTDSFKVTYKHGLEIKSTQSADGKTFVSVEKVPSFPGGIEGFYKFIVKNLKYPDLARKNNTYGKVIVTFVVERDGSLTDVKVSRGIGDGCDEEAVRVIKSSPKWMPGMQDNKPVRVAYSVPIVFGPDK